MKLPNALTAAQSENDTLVQHFPATSGHHMVIRLTFIYLSQVKHYIFKIHFICHVFADCMGTKTAAS